MEALASSAIEAYGRLGESILGSRRRLDHPGGYDEPLITGSVTERVIHVLEMAHGALAQDAEDVGARSMRLVAL